MHMHNKESKKLKTITQEGLNNLLKEHNFNNERVEAVDLSNYDLSGIEINTPFKYTIDFSNSKLDNCTFRNIKFVNCIFDNTSMKNILFLDVDFINVSMRSTAMDNSTFYFCMFEGGEISSMRMVGLNFKNCEFLALSIKNRSHVRFLTFIGCIFDYVTHECTYQSQCTYRSCSIKSMDYYGGMMEICMFEKCELLKCRFGGINSNGEKPYGFTKRGIDFKAVEMYDCLLVRCSGLEIDVLKECEIQSMIFTRRVLNPCMQFGIFTIGEDNRLREHQFACFNNNKFIQCDFANYPYHKLKESSWDNELVNCYCGNGVIEDGTKSIFGKMIGRH